MFLATLYFALPLLGKSRPPPASRPARSLSRESSRRGVRSGWRGWVASSVLGKGIPNLRHLRLGRRCRRALARSFSCSVLLFGGFQWPGLGGLKGCPPARDPAPRDGPGERAGVRRAGGWRRALGRETNLEGKTFPRVASTHPRAPHRAGRGPGVPAFAPHPARRSPPRAPGEWDPASGRSAPGLRAGSRAGRRRLSGSPRKACKASGALGGGGEGRPRQQEVPGRENGLPGLVGGGLAPYAGRPEASSSRRPPGGRALPGAGTWVPAWPRSRSLPAPQTCCCRRR